MATFPTYMKLTHTGPRVTREPVVLRTDMESGPPKQAMARSLGMVTRAVEYACTLANYQLFKTWFKIDVARGAGWFFWSDPEDDVSKLARIVGGVIDEEMPSGKTLDVWILKFKLETWD
jgi:hypothetical protein